MHQNSIILQNHQTAPYDFHISYVSITNSRNLRYPYTSEDISADGSSLVGTPVPGFVRIVSEDLLTRYYEGSDYTVSGGVYTWITLPTFPVKAFYFDSTDPLPYHLSMNLNITLTYAIADITNIEVMGYGNKPNILIAANNPMNVSIKDDTHYGYSSSIPVAVISELYTPPVNAGMEGFLIKQGQRVDVSCDNDMFVDSDFQIIGYKL